MITIIVGTNRENSKSREMAAIYQQGLLHRQVDCQVLDLKMLPADFVFSECFGKRSESYDALLSKYIVSADKFVFILPEYHGGFPGIAKSFLDSFSGDLVKGKHAALVGLSSGRAGNLRGLDAFAAVLGYLQVEVLANRPKLSRIEDVLRQGVLKVEEYARRIDQQMDHLLSV